MFLRSPAISVIRIRFSAPSSAAILEAAVSALTLYVLPSVPLATVAITGIQPLFRVSIIGFTLTLVILPTYPRSSPFSPSARSAVSIFPSIPQRPTAVPLCSAKRATNSLLTFPASTIFTTSIVSLSVYLRPLINLLSIPSLLRVSLISGPPPCTRTTLIPTSESRTISLMTACLSSSLVIAFPPYFTTTILSLYFCI